MTLSVASRARSSRSPVGRSSTSSWVRRWP